MALPELPAALAPGDRMPNFSRPGADGTPFVYYDACCGRPLLLVLVLKPDAPAVSAALADLRELRIPGTAAMIVGRPAQARAFGERHGLECPVLADDGALTRFILAGQAGEAAMRVLLLDANARVRAGWDAWPGRAALAAELEEEAPGRLVTRTAPALIVPRVFEPVFCRHLIEVFGTDNEPSGILRQVDGRMVYVADADTKVRREHRIQDRELLQAVEQRLMRRLLPEIQWAYNYPITRYEAFKVVSYDAAAGGYFRVHRDNDGPDTAHRRFALTLNLNSEAYDGGELRFPEYGPDRYKPDTGSAVVFSCSLAHEALPVQRGTRFALVSFLYGDDTQVRQVQRDDRIARQPV